MTRERLQRLLDEAEAYMRPGVRPEDSKFRDGWRAAIAHLRAALADEDP